MIIPRVNACGRIACALALFACLVTPAALARDAGFSHAYGDDAAAGGYADVNGIRMYYEVYGQGEPLVLIHGSGQSIESMKHQIEYFADRYRVPF